MVVSRARVSPVPTAFHGYSKIMKMSLERLLGLVRIEEGDNTAR